MRGSDNVYPSEANHHDARHLFWPVRLVRRERGRGLVFRPENDTYKLLAQVQGDECPSIAAAAKYRRFPVAHVLIVPQLRTRSPGAVKGSLGDPPHEFKPAATSAIL